MTWLIERQWVSVGALELLFPVSELGVGGLVAQRSLEWGQVDWLALTVDYWIVGNNRGQAADRSKRPSKPRNCGL